MKTEARREWKVPLSWLAGLDHCPLPDALGDAFGDSYLCRHNPIFANIRRSAIESGYRFSAEDTPLWRDYQACSLVTLHQILDSGVIPYHDTGRTIARLLKSNPKVALSPDFLLSNLKANYVFHESAHCVFRRVLKGLECELRAVAPGERERFLLEATLAESLANTVETLGNTFMAMPLSDALFYGLNSYVRLNGARKVALVKAGAETGEYLRFAFVFLASFEANLSSSGPDDAVRDRIGLAANCPAELDGALQTLIEAGFHLSARFRENTTPEYFELLGYQDDYRVLSRGGWLGISENRQFVQRLIPLLFRASISSAGAGSPSEADETENSGARRDLAAG